MADSDEVDGSSLELDEQLICFPCSMVNTQQIAIGYCVNCRDCLCDRCYEVHLISYLTRGHLLSKLDQMTTFELNECKNRYNCQEHSYEKITYHCASHSFLGCHICFYNRHKLCEQGVNIHYVSKDITTSESFSSFNQNLTNISKRCIDLVSSIKGKIKTAETDHTDALTAIKDFKQETMERIYTIEREFIEKANSIKRKEIEKLEKLTRRCCKILDDTNILLERMQLLQKWERNDDIYTTIYTSQEKVRELEEEIQNIESSNRSKRFAFTANTGLTESLMKAWGYGVLHVTEDIGLMEHVNEISIKSDRDISPCLVTGAVLLDDQKIALTDFNNENTLKMFDIASKEIISYTKLSSGAWDVCKIDDSMIAATLPCEKKVVFVNTKPVLELNRELNVIGEPRGIGFSNGKLAVSFCSPDSKIKILDHEGNVTLTVDLDEKGYALFDDPCHIAINPFNELIYISNVRGNNIVCIDWNGTVMGKYRDNDLTYTGKASFDSGGMVYICGNGSNNNCYIKQLTEDCKIAKVMIVDTESLSVPMTIIYQENEGKLFIGQWVGDQIKEYTCVY